MNAGVGQKYRKITIIPDRHNPDADDLERAFAHSRDGVPLAVCFRGEPGSVLYDNIEVRVTGLQDEPGKPGQYRVRGLARCELSFTFVSCEGLYDAKARQGYLRLAK
jgi:hypothetical protein